MKKVLTLTLLLLFFACKEKARQEGDYGFPVSYDLVAKLAADELLTKHPDIEVIDDSLLVVSSVIDVNTDLVKTFSIPDGFREIENYGSRGRGPKEFLYPVLMQAEGHDLLLHNVNISQVVTLEVSNDGDKITEVGRKEFNYDNEDAREKYPERFIRVEPQSLTKLHSGYFVGACYLGVNEFFSLWDKNLNFVTYFGSAPVAQEYDYLVGVNWLSGHTASYGDKFVFGGYYLPYLAMYEVVDGKPAKKWDKYFMQPRYKMGGGAIHFSPNHFGLSLDVKIGRRYIYVAFLGEYAKNWHGQGMSFTAENIFVFDHDGKPVACLNLDHRVHSIAISSDEKTLYAVAVMPEYRIAEYKLPKFK